MRKSQKTSSYLLDKMNYRISFIMGGYYDKNKNYRSQKEKINLRSYALYSCNRHTKSYLYFFF